ncbi:MAG: ribonuclease HI [Phycisphaerales bacterium]
MALPHVQLFTDGACSGNPGPGGWAFILKHPESGKVVEGSGGEARTTNNRMELLSVLSGLRALGKPCAVELFSDSEYVVKGLGEWMDGWKAKGWKRGRNEPVKNVDLWQELDVLRGRHDLRPSWVRGHDGHPENERCDRLAVEAARAAAR